jgi:hypothetical protein
MYQPVGPEIRLVSRKKKEKPLRLDNMFGIVLLWTLEVSRTLTSSRVFEKKKKEWLQNSFRLLTATTCTG